MSPWGECWRTTVAPAGVLLAQRWNLTVCINVNMHIANLEQGIGWSVWEIYINHTETFNTRAYYGDLAPILRLFGHCYYSYHADQWHFGRARYVLFIDLKLTYV